MEESSRWLLDKAGSYRQPDNENEEPATRSAAAGVDPAAAQPQFLPIQECFRSLTMAQTPQLLPLAKIIGRDLELETIEGPFPTGQAPGFLLLDLRESAALVRSLDGRAGFFDAARAPVESVELALELEPLERLFTSQSLQILLPPPLCLLGENRCRIRVGMGRRRKERQKRKKDDIFRTTHLEDPQMTVMRAALRNSSLFILTQMRAPIEPDGVSYASDWTKRSGIPVHSLLMPERVLATLVRKSRRHGVDYP